MLSQKDLKMLQRLLDDLKDGTGLALRMTFLAAAAALSLFVTTAFLTAAAFVFVLNRYGSLYACLTGAAIYLVLTLLVVSIYLCRKKQIQPRPVEKTKSMLQTALSDPVILATGLQVVRTIGVKRLIPILAIGGVALGFLASRQSAEDGDTAED